MRFTSLVPVTLLLASVSTTLALPQHLQERLDSHIYRRALKELKQEIALELAGLEGFEGSHLVRRGDEDKKKKKSNNPFKKIKNAITATSSKDKKKKDKETAQASGSGSTNPPPPNYMSREASVMHQAGYSQDFANAVAPVRQPTGFQDRTPSPGSTLPSYHSKQNSQGSNNSGGKGKGKAPDNNNGGNGGPSGQ